MTDIRKYKKSELKALAQRFRDNGILALIDITTVDPSRGVDHKEQSESRIATLNRAVLDCLDFAAEHAGEG